MEIEYSNEVKGKVHAYRFEKWEKEIIINGLKSEIKRRNTKIDRVDNSPRNEGQVTFLSKRRELRHEINTIEEIINELSK